MLRSPRRTACVILLTLWCLAMQVVVTSLPRDAELCLTATCAMVVVPIANACCAADPVPGPTPEPNCPCAFVPLPDPVLSAAMSLPILAEPPPAYVVFVLPEPMRQHSPAMVVPISSGPDPARLRSVVLIC